jgi:hypothetical protein
MYTEMGIILNAEQKKPNTKRLNPILEYLDDRHGTVGSERKKLIDQIYKTVIDNIVPDYIKIILQRCDEKVKFDPDGENISKMMKCSKYQLNELVKEHDIG